MAVNNICKQCGGVKNFTFEVQAVPGIQQVRAIPGNRPVKICSCPIARAKKHDKHKLDDRDEAVVQFGAAYPGEEGIYITLMDESVYLDAGQALSLLAWLEQERPTLERLSKESEH